MTKQLMIAVTVNLLVLSFVWTLDAFALEKEREVISRPAASVYVESEPCAEWYQVSPDQMPIRFQMYRVRQGSWQWYELREGGHYVNEQSLRESEKRISLTLEEGDALMRRKETAIGFVADWTEPEWQE